MYTIIADTHTHTLVSGHAYSTIGENVEAAMEKGLDAIIMTDHSPSMPGGPPWIYFTNFHSIPDQIRGVAIIKGIEVNIMDYDGTLDLDIKILRKMQWIIASMHTTNLKFGTKEQHTRAWINVIQNPLVDVIGHCGDERYAFDYEPVLKLAKEHDKIIEINSHSFKAREGSDINCKRIAAICAELEIPVTVCSDAHYAGTIGNFEMALKMLEEINFPEKLIVNADKERFFKTVEARQAYR